MGPWRDAARASAALQVAVAIRGGTVAGVVLHTDQGRKYTGELFKAACRAAGATRRWAAPARRWTTPVAEAFNSSLECELLGCHHFITATWCAPGCVESLVCPDSVVSRYQKPRAFADEEAQDAQELSPGVSAYFGAGVRAKLVEPGGQRRGVDDGDCAAGLRPHSGSGMSEERQEVLQVA